LQTKLGNGAGLHCLGAVTAHLQLLPTRSGSAAENMALDFLLLQRFPEPQIARFRHYGWHRPAFTFGYSQKIAAIRASLPAGERFELCRRPTGGGLVDHRDDWTYSLVIPRGHPLEEQPAPHSYRLIHEALAVALRAQGVAAAVKSAPDEDAAGPAGICFERAEKSDVVRASDGAKIAGAAQKRNKHGLLFQGSLWRPAAGAAVDWDQFHGDFAAQLATVMGLSAGPAPWPELNEEEVTGLTERYESPEWLEQR
jgi:lipoate-protein ligase A